jgi:hypothetical protein
LQGEHASGGFEHGYRLFVKIDGFIQGTASAVVFAQQLTGFVVGIASNTIFVTIIDTIHVHLLVIAGVFII